MVVFSKEDSIFITNLYKLKGYGAKQLIKELLTKGWKLRALIKSLFILLLTLIAVRSKDTLYKCNHIVY